MGPTMVRVYGSQQRGPGFPSLLPRLHTLESLTCRERWQRCSCMGRERELRIWVVSQAQGLLCVVSMSISPSNPGTTAENLLLEGRTAASGMFNSFKLLCQVSRSVHLVFASKHDTILMLWLGTELDGSS